MKKILNFCIVAVFFIAACAQPEAAPDETESQETIEVETPIKATPESTETEEVEMEKDKVAVVIARDRYQSLEFNPVVSQLKAAGYEVVILSDEIGMAEGTQERTEIEMTFRDANPSDFASIVLIGGSKSLWQNTELHALLNAMQSDGKLVSAICYGTVTLAYAGVLKEGDKACWYNSSESDPVMKRFGIFDTEADVTLTDKMITGDGPDAANEFAANVVDYLNSH